MYRQDEAEANGGGLRALEEMLREADGREQEAAQGASRTQSSQVLPPLRQFVHETSCSGHHSHHVPLLRARLHLQCHCYQHEYNACSIVIIDTG